MPGEVIVGAIAVTLDYTAKVDRNELVQAFRLPTDVPFKKARPHPGFSVSRTEVFDGGFIHLDTGPAHHLCFD